MSSNFNEIEKKQAIEKPVIVILKHFKGKSISEGRKKKYKRLGHHLIVSDFSYFKKFLSYRLSLSGGSSLIFGYKRKDHFDDESKVSHKHQFYLIYIKKISSTRMRYTFKQIRKRTILIPIAPHIFLLPRIKPEVIRKFNHLISSDDVIQWLRYNCNHVLIIPYLSPFNKTSKKKLFNLIRSRYILELGKLQRKIKKLKQQTKETSLETKKIHYNARKIYSELRKLREVLQLLRKILGISLSKEYNKVYVSFMRFYKTLLLKKAQS
ncbi:MAG: hypothetical protein J7L47_02650 [Candidatus Odinarchaeota archaeon]|nr:hypothetical protein [Candidatus Odinarchaeota archaeon]